MLILLLSIVSYLSTLVNIKHTEVTVSRIKRKIICFVKYRLTKSVMGGEKYQRTYLVLVMSQANLA